MINQCQKDESEQSAAATFGTRDCDLDVIAKRIQSGEAILEVIAYPWGVEYELCKPPQHLDSVARTKQRTRPVGT